MKSEFIIAIFYMLVVSCNNDEKHCKPELKEFLFHNNSSVCKFRSGDSITERFITNKDYYEELHPYQPQNSCFIIDGNSNVFEYNYKAKQCYSEVYWEYFLFQIPSYLEEFKVQDKNLEYLHCALDQTCQFCECFEWDFNRGTINGKRINDSTWFVNVDITAHCKDSLFHSELKIKYNANYIKHKGNCKNYLYKKK
jgi:hypothetical protein